MKSRSLSCISSSGVRRLPQVKCKFLPDKACNGALRTCVSLPCSMACESNLRCRESAGRTHFCVKFFKCGSLEQREAERASPSAEAHFCIQ